MTLLRQNIQFLLPLFLVLGILYAYISFMLQTKELKWAVDQEAKAIGHTIQSFVEHTPEKYLYTTDGSLTIRQELEAILNRIVVQNKNESISVLSASGDTLYHELTIEPVFEHITWENPEILYDSSFEETHFRLERSNDFGRLVIQTHLVISDNILTLVIIRNGQDYLLRIQELRRWIALEILIALIIGILVSIFLTMFIRQRINTLTQLSANFLQGNSALKLDQGAISEFNDLGSTLNILVNVYHKNIDWYRKSIQRNEQSRTSQILADYFLTKNDHKICFSKNGLTVIADFAGNQSYSIFMGTTYSSNSPALIWGIVDEKEPIEATLLSDAISKYIQKQVDSNSVLSDCMSLFGSRIESINQLIINDNGIATIVSQSKSHAGQERSLEMSARNDFWVHDLGGEVTEKIDMYCQHTSKSDTDHLFKEIKELVGLFGSTVLIHGKQDGKAE